jgi:hypothetical protein
MFEGKFAEMAMFLFLYPQRLLSALLMSQYRDGLQDRRPRFDSRQVQGFFSIVFRPALGHNQPPIEWVPRALTLWI